MNQIINLVSWYLALAGIGWLVLPIAYRFLRALPERGYAFVRPLGLFLWGFVFWLLSSFGLLANNPGGLIAALLLVGGLSYWALRNLPSGELRAWLRAKRKTIISTEVIFAIAFLFMAYIRATGPEIFHTEQPMEMAFINAILHSPTMPPHDPWLSGFSISYYYFGYLLVAMMAKLLAVAGPVAFNLGFISIFAMAATAAYGLVVNLLSLYRPQGRHWHWLAGIAPVFVLILGNAEGLLEIMHANHLFWRTDASGAQSSGFWAWMDIKDLVNPPSDTPKLTPRNYGTDYWWWWRASRVINDRTFSGGEQELIDEFPAFSYVLGDLHPHVLSMPFVLMAMAFALNLYLGGAERKEPLSFLKLRIEPTDLALLAMLIGSLAFLNIWDFPIYIILLTGAYILRRAQTEGWRWALVEDLFLFTVFLGVSGILIYLPFYISFTSQAGGILPNLLNPTRGTHFWVMFVTLLTPILVYLLFLWNRTRQSRLLLKGLLSALGFVLGLWVLSLGSVCFLAHFFPDTGLGQAILQVMGAPDFGSLLSVSVQRRLAAAGGWLSIIVLLGLFLGLVFAVGGRNANKQQPTGVKAHSFAVLLALVAGLLVTAPEFIFLNDQFDTRMNTVFKFYAQAWLMWGVVASFATIVVLNELRGVGRVLAGAAISITLLAGLVYPAFAFSDIAKRPAGQALSLDGSQHLSQDALAAINWLEQQPKGNLVEAVGGSYSAFGRYATFSGQPGLMGWPGHEGQWRNNIVDYGRIGDIEVLYSTADWLTAQTLLDKYDIKYVVLGELENGAYRVSAEKFQNLAIGFQSGQVIIYVVP